jgi:hypothetical protein
MWKSALILVSCVCMSVQVVFAHSGGTDSYGCHAGTEAYHCHEKKYEEASWEEIIGAFVLMGVLLAIWMPEKEKPANIFEETKGSRPNIFLQYDTDRWGIKWIPFSW